MDKPERNAESLGTNDECLHVTFVILVSFLAFRHWSPKGASFSGRQRILTETHKGRARLLSMLSRRMGVKLSERLARYQATAWRIAWL
ncbi:MAG TPA: hypothetical protein VFS12_12545, partial [Terriglobia bacterium]|nr:hypothetical protein [Terriglobia bacterium]